MVSLLDVVIVATVHGLDLGLVHHKNIPSPFLLRLVGHVRMLMVIDNQGLHGRSIQNLFRSLAAKRFGTHVIFLLALAFIGQILFTLIGKVIWDGRSRQRCEAIGIQTVGLVAGIVVIDIHNVLSVMMISSFLVERGLD